MQEEHSRYDDELARAARQAGAARRSATAPAAPAVRGRRRRRRPRRVAVKAARAGVHGQERARRSAARATWSSRSRAARSSWTTSRAICPPDMKAMDKTKQAAVIAEKQKERNEINKRIDELSKLRKTELDAHERRRGQGGRRGRVRRRRQEGAAQVGEGQRRGRASTSEERAMNTNWRFRDHRGFQHDALVGHRRRRRRSGALAWALPLAGATWWMMMAVGPLLALLVGREAAPRRRAGATWSRWRRRRWGRCWRARPGGRSPARVGVAGGGRRAAGRAAGGAGGVVGAGDRARRAGRRSAAGARAGRGARGAGRAGGGGAGAGGAGGDRARPDRRRAGRRRRGADGRRLARMAEDVTREVLALAVRCRKLRGELERIDVGAVRARAGALTRRRRRQRATRRRAPI